MNETTNVTLVTGSSSGIGEATVNLLAKQGLKIVVVGSKRERERERES